MDGYQSPFARQRPGHGYLLDGVTDAEVCGQSAVHRVAGGRSLAGQEPAGDQRK
jgi:hypothetical protein